MVTRLGAIVALFMFVTVLVGCGSGSDSTANDFGGFSASIDMDSSDEQAAEAVSPPSDSQAVRLSTAGIERRVIRSGELYLYVSDIERAVRHAREVAADFGGYVDSSSARLMSDQDETASLTLEIPSREFDNVMAALREGPYVTQIEHESTSSRDVTEEYIDLQSRIGNLKATEARFVALLEEARTIEEILRVEQEVSRVRGEIEQIQGRINYLEQRTDFSRISVNYQLEREPVRIGGWEFTPGETAREAWDSSMQFLGTLASAAIMIGVFFWWAWPILLISVVLAVRYRRRRQVTIQQA